MRQTALNLTEHVLPAVPLRQWVFTLPHPLRARLAYDAPLLGAVTRLFVDSVLGWYQTPRPSSARCLAPRPPMWPTPFKSLAPASTEIWRAAPGDELTAGTSRHNAKLMLAALKVGRSC